MEYNSQNQCGCSGGRSQRMAPGNYASMRTTRPAPGCGCQNRVMPRGGGSDWSGYPIGMAYVPWQQFRDLHSYENGLCAGTIFRELDKPFMMGRCAK